MQTNAPPVNTENKKTAAQKIPQKRNHGPLRLLSVHHVQKVELGSQVVTPLRSVVADCEARGTAQLTNSSMATSVIEQREIGRRAGGKSGRFFGGGS